MAKTLKSGKGALDRKTITLIAAILVLVLAVGVIVAFAHGKAAPSKEQAAVEGQKALERATELVNSGRAGGTTETTKTDQ